MKTLFDCETEDEVRELIANGANVNEKNQNGDTALHYASEKGNK